MTDHREGTRIRPHPVAKETNPTVDEFAILSLQRFQQHVNRTY
ncbi:MAG: hypothetical protein SFY66_02555 [Oculatellaceae cyanobacterium bins.114]|nr:hypothetical protein [Oculatellaceae cyanobacterium bins.114]